MKYYTYCHTRNDTGQVFYIGKGSGKRVNSKQHRNIWWKNIANKVGYSSNILAYWESELEAFEHEKFLISIIPNLVNVTHGGEGASGYKHTPEQNEIKSKKMREYHRNNPQAAKLWGVNRKALHTKANEWKLAQSERNKKLHSDPEYQKKFSIAQRKVRAKPVESTDGKLFFDAVTDGVDWLKKNGYPKMSTSYLARCIKLGRKLLGKTFKYKETDK